MNLHIETPLLASRALAIQPGQTVWLKMEALQPPGSFKIRGMGLACQTYAQRGARRFISSSGGNAGLAVAYAGRCLSIPVLVVVPETTSERAKALIRQQGAEVRVHGPSWQEANALAQSMLGPQDAFLHPFDDPLLWQGHASMVEEVARAGVKPDAVLLSVGGGGLLCGVVQGLREQGWQDVPVIAVETLGADSLAQAMVSNQRIELPRIASIASSLGARQVCEQAFAWASGRHPVRSLVVSDKAAVAACLGFLDEHRVLVEPACGASLAALREAPEMFADYKNILVIVCGGATATLAQLQAWAAQL
jgi:L-serine/L-threonine ammonia-lyase